MTRPSLARRLDRQDGAISIMAAVLAAAMVMATALAVDVGRITYTSRDQQGVTDRAVLDALRHLETVDSDGDGVPDVGDGATLGEIHDLVAASVGQTLAANTEGSSVGTAEGRHASLVEIGYQDPACPGSSTFCLMYDGPGGVDPDPYDAAYVPQDPNRSMNAIRVATTSTVPYVFGFIGGENTERIVVKEAVGTDTRTCIPGTTGCPVPTCPSPPCDAVPIDAEGGIAVASRLLEFDSDSSPVFRALLAGLLGMPDPTKLNLVGFDGLATASVPLGDALGIDATIGTVDQLLDAEVTLADMFTAMASGATADDAAVQTEARAFLGELAHETTLGAAVDPALRVVVGDLVRTTTEDPSALLLAEVNALDLLMNALLTAEFVNGDSFVDLDVSGSNVLGLEGLLQVTAGLRILEAPQMAYGPVRYDAATGEYETVARTAQVELQVGLELLSDEVDTLLGPTLTGLLEDALCLPLLSLLGCPHEQAVSISVSAAQAEAQLSGIDCLDPEAASDLTTIVTSDTLTATVGSDAVTLVDTRDGGSEGIVIIPEVPGQGTTTVDNTASLTDIPVLDALLDPVLGVLGIDTGTAAASSWAIRCDVPVLLANPVPGATPSPAP